MNKINSTNAENVDFKEVVEVTLDRIRRVSKIEKRDWTPEVCVAELVKQVGELSKEILLAEGYYHESESQSKAESIPKIADEIADIFYIIVRIADNYGIDVLESCVNARRIEDEFLKSRGI